MRQKYGPVALWVLISVLIAVLTVFNPAHFVSVDSQYYLSKAGVLVGLNGDQYGHKAVGWEVDFPIAYPLLIGGLARATGLSLLVASKGVNCLLIGVFLLIWWRRVGNRSALWMGSVFLLGGYLRIVTYTWSECVFLVVLMEWFWVVRELAFPALERVTYRQTIRLLLISVFLFSLRYAGSFFVVAYGLWVIRTYGRGGWPVIRRRIGPDLLYGFGATAFILGTFYVNSLLSPWPLGTERFYETTETVWEKVLLLLLAPVNELLLTRDYVIGEPNALVWLGLLLQVTLFWWLWQTIRSNQLRFTPFSGSEKQFFTLWLWVSATYLIGLYTMRWFSPFSGPNARMMSVVTLPLLMGVAHWVSQQTNEPTRRQLRYWWIALLFCSWLQLLPQADFWAKMAKLLARVW